MEEVSDHLMKLNAFKSVGPDDMHPRVLKKMDDVDAELPSIVFERSWLSGKVQGDWKKGKCPWEDHGADPPGRDVKAHER